MIKVLEDAIEKVKKLPPEQQEYAAEILEQIAAANDAIYTLSEDERRLVREAASARQVALYDLLPRSRVLHSARVKDLRKFPEDAQDT